jgi:hypothetical protein
MRGRAFNKKVQNFTYATFIPKELLVEGLCLSVLPTQKAHSFQIFSKGGIFPTMTFKHTNIKRVHNGTIYVVLMMMITIIAINLFISIIRIHCF